MGGWFHDDDDDDDDAIQFTLDLYEPYVLTVSRSPPIMVPYAGVQY